MVGAPASMTAMRAVAGRRQMTTSNVLAPDAVCWMALAASSLVSSSASSAAGEAARAAADELAGAGDLGRMAGEDAPPGPVRAGPANRAARRGEEIRAVDRHDPGVSLLADSAERREEPRSPARSPTVWDAMQQHYASAYVSASCNYNLLSLEADGAWAQPDHEEAAAGR